jgi:Spy/CpxP family protein refolding chaperone
MWIAFPGLAALAAGEAFGRTGETTDPRGAATLHVSRKALSTGAKASYELPKNAAKQAKFLSSLTALLSLDATQQQQAAAIFTSAVNNRIGIHATMKSVRKVLSTAVQNNDGSGIAQASAQIGSLMTQYVSNGAAANAAFFQLLTPDQRAKLVQYQGQPTPALA